MQLLVRNQFDTREEAKEHFEKMVAGFMSDWNGSTVQ